MLFIFSHWELPFLLYFETILVGQVNLEPQGKIHLVVDLEQGNDGRPSARGCLYMKDELLTESML